MFIKIFYERGAPVEISQLEAFEQVAREGSFSRAADTLGLTQPAISARIAGLETELGGSLFERHGRQLHLTPLGERFLPYAQRILAVRADSLEDIRSFRRGQTGEIKLAAPTPFILSFLVDVLMQFRHVYPSADIFIRERNKTTIFEMLVDRSIMLGLVNAPVFDRQFVQLARFQEPIRAVVAPEHALAQMQLQQESILMEEIYRHTIFRVSMFPQMTAFMDSVVEHGRHGSGGAVISIPMVMALQLVLAGQGITFLPESYVKPAIANSELVILNIQEMPPLRSQPVVIALKDRKLDKMHLEFIEILKQHLHHLLVID